MLAISSACIILKETHFAVHVLMFSCPWGYVMCLSSEINNIGLEGIRRKSCSRGIGACRTSRTWLALAPRHLHAMWTIGIVPNPVTCCYHYFWNKWLLHCSSTAGTSRTDSNLWSRSMGLELRVATVFWFHLLYQNKDASLLLFINLYPVWNMKVFRNQFHAFGILGICKFSYL